MAECVRLGLVDTDFGWSSHRETTKVDWFWRSHEESVVCNPAHLSLCFLLSLSLPPLPWVRGQRAVYGRSWR